MPAQSDAQKALELIRKSGFQWNADCEAAHEIAQTFSGSSVFDAIHAHLHRIEGDLPNAAYWDRMAGTDLGRDGIEAEFKKLQDLVTR